MKPRLDSSRNLLRRARRGLSLMEMIIVIALIGLVAGILISGLGGIFEGSQEDTVKIFVDSSVATPLMQYRIHTGSYPTTDQGLDALRSNPAGSSKWRGPYLDKELPEDPWGEPYQYRYPGTNNPEGYDIWSKGPDRQSGTADDIGNWETETAAAN